MTCPLCNQTPKHFLFNIEVKYDEAHSKTVKINDTLKMDMKYPSLDQFVKNNFEFDSPDMDQSFELIASCVDKIYDEEEVWSTDDVGTKEVVEFLEQMNSNQFKEIEKFFMFQHFFNNYFLCI